jgi:hypothetical protein
MADTIQLRAWRQLKYHDPEPVLRKLREVEFRVLDANLPPNVRHLRTNELKSLRESRDAALFTLGIAEALGTKVLLAPVEAADYDFVTAWGEGDTLHFCPVQLKEWVPEELNPTVGLPDLFASIARSYPTSSETVVAVHVNRVGTLDVPSLEIPPLPVAELWLFGAVREDQSEWVIVGDLLGEPRQHSFRYPWP